VAVVVAALRPAAAVVLAAVVLRLRQVPAVRAARA
jgi:hypothetical protein